MSRKLKKKIDYWKPFNESMYDCCWCGSNCATSCARNKKYCKSKYPVTMSLLGETCSRYVENKPTYKLIKAYPNVDWEGHIRGSQWDKEVVFTEKELDILVELLFKYRSSGMTVNEIRKKICKVLDRQIPKEIKKQLEEK